MNNNKLGNSASVSDKSRSRGRRKERRLPGDSTRIGSDLVLLGALMSLVSTKVGGADVPATDLRVNESVDSESFGHAMQSMSGKNSEILMLATLAEDLHRSLAGSFKAAQTRFDVPIIHSQSRLHSRSMQCTVLIPWVASRYVCRKRSAPVRRRSRVRHRRRLAAVRPLPQTLQGWTKPNPPKS